MDRSDPLTPKNRFPHPAVTSNLAPHLKSAHHDRGEGSIGKSHNNDPKPFVVKILTSKPSAIKILHTLFANPAPSKLLQGQGEGGYLQSRSFFSFCSVPSDDRWEVFPPQKSTSPYWFLPFDLGLLLKDFLR